MKFLLDHDVPAEVARVLRQAGHDVVCVADEPGATATDEAVLLHAHKKKRVLVTCNRDDFLELAKEKLGRSLIILIRRRTRISESAALIRLINKAGESGIKGNINFA